MQNYNFTKNEVLAEVRRTFKEEICLDMMDDARCEETIEDAAEVIILNSAYWNGTW